MKVLFLHSQCGKGAISRIVFSICDLLEAEGSQGRFAFSRGFVPNDKNQICHMFGNKLEVTYHMVMSRLCDAHGFYSSRATKELISFIEEYSPNIIHLNNIHGYYLNIEILFNYLKRKEIPIIWTLHDCWAITGHCSHFEYYKCEQWKNGCNKCKHKEVYPTSWIISRATRNYQKKRELFCNIKKMNIVVPSRWLFNIVGNSFLKEYPCRIINNGIDLTVFNIKDTVLELSQELKHKKIVLAVANVWTKRKGYDDIIKLSQVIDKEEYALVVIGVTQSQKEELERFGVFAFLHTKNVEELAAWYSYASVFINPTYEDTFPTVNIESLACGTPVITYETGGSPEILNDACGAVIEKGNIDQLYKAIQSINKNPALCRKVAEGYDAYDKFQEYLALYSEMIQEE